MRFDKITTVYTLLGYLKIYSSTKDKSVPINLWNKFKKYTFTRVSDSLIKICISGVPGYISIKYYGATIDLSYNNGSSVTTVIRYDDSFSRIDRILNEYHGYIQGKPFKSGSKYYNSNQTNELRVALQDTKEMLRDVSKLADKEITSLNKKLERRDEVIGKLKRQCTELKSSTRTATRMVRNLEKRLERIEAVKSGSKP